jgi:hypothetical protein
VAWSTSGKMLQTQAAFADSPRAGERFVTETGDGKGNGFAVTGRSFGNGCGF